MSNHQIKIHQNFLLAYIRMAIPYRTAKFKSANMLVMAIWDPTAKFNSHQYFWLYSTFVWNLLHWPLEMHGHLYSGVDTCQGHYTVAKYYSHAGYKPYVMGLPYSLNFFGGKYFMVLPILLIILWSSFQPRLAVTYYKLDISQEKYSWLFYDLWNLRKISTSKILGSMVHAYCTCICTQNVSIYIRQSLCFTCTYTATNHVEFA